MKPKVRFKGFSGEWKEIRLGEIGDICMCKRVMKNETNTSGPIPFYKIGTFGNGADAFIPEELFLEYKKKYSYPRKGEVLFSAAGTIGRSVVFDGEPAYFQDSNIVWITNSEKIVSNFFLKCAYSIISWNIEDGGIVKRLYNDNIRKTSILIPTLPEQTTIATFFTHLDTLISSTSRRLEKLRAVKAASLQSMFPQEGEKEPRVRFKGFSGEWVKVQLGDIATFSKGHGYSKNDIIKTGTPIILYGSLYTKYQFAINGVNTFAKLAPGSVLSEGNEVVIPASGETTEDIARASAVLKPNVIIGGDLNVLSFDLTKFSTPFIALIITNGAAHYTLSKSAQGKTVVHLNNGEIRKASIYLPSLPEQTAIANYFTHLDDLIQSTSRRLDKLRAVKAACLEGMFV